MKYSGKSNIFIPRIDFSLILETLLSRSIECIIKKQSTNHRVSPSDRKLRENNSDQRLAIPGLETGLGYSEDRTVLALCGEIGRGEQKERQTINSE